MRGTLDHSEQGQRRLHLILSSLIALMHLENKCI